MISGNEPVKAMTYISELQLFSAVFSLPPVVEPSTPEGSERYLLTYCLSVFSSLDIIFITEKIILPLFPYLY